MPENASLNVEFQNFLAIGKDGLGSPSLGPGSSVREKGKKTSWKSQKNSASEVGHTLNWEGGKGGRTWRNALTLPPFHLLTPGSDIMLWLVKCLNVDKFAVLLTDEIPCSFNQTLVVPQSWGISLWIDLVVLHQWHTAYFPLKHLYFAYVTSTRRIQTFLTKVSY